MCELYEVDPNGDLLIILSSPTDEAFVPWNESDDELTVSPGLLETDSTSQKDLLKRYNIEIQNMAV